MEGRISFHHPCGSLCRSGSRCDESIIDSDREIRLPAIEGNVEVSTEFARRTGSVSSRRPSRVIIFFLLITAVAPIIIVVIVVVAIAVIIIDSGVQGREISLVESNSLAGVFSFGNMLVRLTPSTDSLGRRFARLKNELKPSTCYRTLIEHSGTSR